MIRHLRKAAAIAVAGAAALTFTATTGNAQPAAPRAHHQATLGSKRYAAPNGSGWGHPHPQKIFNSGDPSGEVDHIHWHHWGAARSIGDGKTAAFKPGGGYYGRKVHCLVWSVVGRLL